MKHCPVCGHNGDIEHPDGMIRNCRNCGFMWNTTLPGALLLDMVLAHVRENKSRRNA